MQRVMSPKVVVFYAKKALGPTILTASVAGSWKQMFAAVNRRIETEKRLPTKSRSRSMLVTDAEESMLLSKRSRLQSIPAMRQSRKSIRRARAVLRITTSEFEGMIAMSTHSPSMTNYIRSCNLVQRKVAQKKVTPRRLQYCFPYLHISTRVEIA